MRDPDSAPEVPPESARALGVTATVESTERQCPACGRPLTVRQRAGCSAKCRAALSRRRQDEARRARDREIRRLLLTAQESIEAAWTKLEDA
jgi:predicted nucleic acid-binding Zn ribbon protein